MDSTLIGNKSESLEQGIVFMPYIMETTTPTIVEFSFKNRIRKNKINKIYNLGLDIETFPSKTIATRYLTKTINSNYYGKMEIK